MTTPFIKNGPTGTLDEEVEKRVNDVRFQNYVVDFFQDGNLEAIDKKSDFSLQFVPDDAREIEPWRRQKFAQLSAFIAPPPPIDRPFVYVGLGTGILRQDLHQILVLLDKKDPETGKKIESIHIALIDTAYASDDEFNSFYSGVSQIDVLAEFKAILQLKAPGVAIQIDVFADANAFVDEYPESPVDLLTAVRFEVTHEDANSAINLISEKLSADSGRLLTNTNKANLCSVLIKKGGEDKRLFDYIKEHPDSKEVDKNKRPAVIFFPFGSDRSLRCDEWPC